MKTALLAALSLLLFSAVYVSTDNPAPEISSSGICVVEFNASFNAANSVAWINKISDCTTNRIDIAASPDLQKEHKIVVVPTIIVFNEGEEEDRKSTRLNSSHGYISYAVFCLKKKKK